jgi:hypothetical protein
MGLDMYLRVRDYVSRLKYSEPQKPEESMVFKEILRLTGNEGIVEPGGYMGMYVEIPVYYWRKANAIHKWFVDNVADGVDDCKPFEFEYTKLEDLLKSIKAVLDDNKLAPEILPTQSGFFFGTEDFDEWYFDTLKATHEDLTELYQRLDSKDDDAWLVYEASW